MAEIRPTDGRRCPDPSLDTVASLTPNICESCRAFMTHQPTLVFAPVSIAVAVDQRVVDRVDTGRG